jgi:putative copper resistance protein D
MNWLVAAVRSVHYASTLLLFGELVFLLAVAGSAPAIGSAAADAFARRFTSVARWSLFSSVVSGIAWFAVAAAVMSGLPLADALDRGTLSQVLTDTEFGRVAMLRFGVAIVLGGLLVAFARALRQGTRSGMALGMLALAAVYVAALAWAGHAAAGVETSGEVEVITDAVHVLAAGAWLGALPGFVFLLRRTHAAAEALPATRRFSLLGMMCVVLLAASGTANAWFLVGDVPALIGTSYGRLLLVKLALFGAMLALAIANRWYVTLRLAEGDAKAPHALRRNAIAEIVLGLVIVAIVGVLGVTPPAIHETPVWPFEHTLSFARAEQSQWLLMALAAASLTACVCVGALVAGIRGHRIWQSLGSLAVIACLAAILIPMLATRAYPSTYWSSPIPYTTDAIVAGSTLYASSCRQCHGAHRLDAALAPSRAGTLVSDATDHALRHRDGEHYWWIAHGIPGTSMPGFGSRLSEEDIWNLIEFLNAQVEAEEATAMTDRIKPLRAIVAPDFAFEGADRPQESLRQLRGKAAALVVLYTLPQSMPRLRELAADVRSYSAAGARVIAAPLATPADPAAALPDDVRDAIATADATVAAAYALFARRSEEPADTPAHVEFLIDRDGYLRVRWIGVGEDGVKRTSETLDRIAILRRETPLAPAPWGHRHR